MIALLLFAAALQEGPVVEKWDNGKTKLKTTYRGGKPHGSYEEFWESGKPRLKAHYEKGLRHGTYREFAEDGRTLLRDAVYHEDVLLYPKPAAQISAVLKKLEAESKPVGPLYAEPPNSAPPMTAGKMGLGHLKAALARLKAYRYIADVPYEDLALNDRYCRESQAGVVLLNVIGRLDHTPDRPPTMPEEFYRVAYEGTSRSNLHWNSAGATLHGGIDNWMDDSDRSNVAVLGHRRWNLNPAMREVGFGLMGEYAAIWAHDGGRARVPDYDVVCFPTRGFHPIAYFPAGAAWSVSLNPDKYAEPDRSKVKIGMWEADKSLKRSAKPIEIDYLNVNNDGFGIPRCVIFRPRGITQGSGKRYWVEVTGLAYAKGNDAVVKYLVEFIP
jgi:hypothetical protein